MNFVVVKKTVDVVQFIAIMGHSFDTIKIYLISFLF